MRMIQGTSIVLLLAGLASGCTSDDYLRTEGPTVGAGNAQAANTVMQMVDPWKYGVQDTKLLVPAQRSSPLSTNRSEASRSGSTATRSRRPASDDRGGPHRRRYTPRGRVAEWQTRRP